MTYAHTTTCAHIHTHANRICVIRANGEYVRSFGRFGKGEGQIQNPLDVSVVHHSDPCTAAGLAEEAAGEGESGSGRHSVVVLDSGNGRFATFDGETGEWLTSIAFCSLVQHPTSFAVVAPNVFAVCCTATCQIVVQDADKQVDFVFGGRGTAYDKLNSPTAVRASYKGRLAVCDAGNHRVIILRPLQ